eukprot:COSAG01_NODE_4650_length_4850_cov_2.236211_6_plen_64_part_00
MMLYVNSSTWMHPTMAVQKAAADHITVRHHLLSETARVEHWRRHDCDTNLCDKCVAILAPNHS